MKFAVFALVSMYVIVQTCGNIILNRPSSIQYYKTQLGSRKFLAAPATVSTYDSHYYNKQHNKYNHKQKYSHSLSASSGRKLLLPLPIVPVPYGGVSGVSSSYNAGSSAASAANSNQYYNYQQSLRRGAATEEPYDAAENGPTVVNCDNQGEVETEEPEIEEKIESNAERYRIELCLYIWPKVSATLQKLDSEDDYIDFVMNFLTPVDKYCDFAHLM